jgi:hypothetical protein
MHLLLEQDSDDALWHSASRSSGYIGTVSDHGVFTLSEIQTAVNSLSAESVIILFIRRNTPNDLASIQTVVDKCIAVDKDLRIWCHYGGDIDFRALPDFWAAYTYLTCDSMSPKESINKRLTNQRFSFPLPFSNNFSLKWESKVLDAKEVMKKKTRGSANSSLNEAWTLAETELDKFDAMSHILKALRWRIVVGEIKCKLDAVPTGSVAVEDWDKLSKLAVSVGVGDYSPHYSDEYDDSTPPIHVMENMYNKLTSNLHWVSKQIEYSKNTNSKLLNVDPAKMLIEECIQPFETAYSALRAKCPQVP